jgi:hypothetical protein
MDAIGAWPTLWSAACMLEGHRFWFYSLVFSILLGLVQLFWIQGGNERPKKISEKAHSRIIFKAATGAGGEKAGRSAGSQSQEGVKRRLVSDCFDLLIPGHVTGWISTSTVTVGFASVISTLLSSKDIVRNIRFLISHLVPSLLSNSMYSVFREVSPTTKIAPFVHDKP